MKSTNRKGFTLIELLIVVVIIGILAAIAIPKFASTKEKAYIAAMKTDLRNLVTAQEGYFSDKQAFTTDLSATGLNYSPSQNVNLTAANITVAATGWEATGVTHALVANKQCAVYVGANATTANQKDGVPVCP
jgi:prepilin-type N-terminal cleavage/methylation domain-containing protein